MCTASSFVPAAPPQSPPSPPPLRLHMEPDSFRSCQRNFEQAFSLTAALLLLGVGRATTLI